MTKLIIQIPCYNEQNTLPETLATIPSVIEGIDEIEILIIDDGSTDQTIEVAQSWGVHHIARHPRNRGLAAAFKTGLQTSLGLGADIIVNTDADNQYPQQDIPRLLRPILQGEAELVIGARQFDQIKHFTPTKRFLQKMGSWVVRQASELDIPDATSGFRAISRDAALHLNVFTSYTYTLDTLIQAGKKGIITVSIPVETNPQSRPSRLVKSSLNYVRRSIPTILRIYTLYESLRVFALISLPFMLVGLALIARYLIDYLDGFSAGHIQSVIIGSSSLIIGTFILLFGMLADLISMNRRLLEEMLYLQRKAQFTGENEESVERIEMR